MGLLKLALTYQLPFRRVKAIIATSKMGQDKCMLPNRMSMESLDKPGISNIYALRSPGPVALCGSGVGVENRRRK